MKLVDDIYISKALYSKMIDEVCEQFKLTNMELTVLLFVANYPEHNTATDIVERRGITKSHVSMAVHSLQSKGLVKCEKDANNKRIIRIFPSERAKVVIEAGRNAQNRFMQIYVDGFLPEEKMQLVSFIERISKNVKNKFNELEKNNG